MLQVGATGIEEEEEEEEEEDTKYLYSQKSTNLNVRPY
jgi:hypothetical protein